MKLNNERCIIKMLGAIIGDICGSIYEFNPVNSKDEIVLMKKGVKFTDDTVLTMAIADSIINKRNYVDNLIKFYQNYPNGMGYGKRFFRWVISKEHKPYGSYGNGSAMRVSPVGFYFNSTEEVLVESKKRAEVTHNHIEGIKGAQAVALSIYLARNNYTKEQIKNEITKRFNYNLDFTVDNLSLNNHHNETCQRSVPEAIVAFLKSTSYVSAIKNAIWLRGDADTQACIAGAIAEAFYREIPEELKTKALELIPDEFIEILTKFYKEIEFDFHYKI